MITSTVLKRTLTTLFTAALLMGGLGTGQAALIDQLDGDRIRHGFKYLLAPECEHSRHEPVWAHPKP